jgi:hypothetical protein
MAGYSKRSLLDKLGIEAGMRVALLGVPEGYDELLGPLPADTRRRDVLRGEQDFIQMFVRDEAELLARLPRAVRALEPDGMLWVSWPKKSSGFASDLSEDVVRRHALAAGLVDVKVCAVDDVWSGLKLVFRREGRAALRAQRGITGKAGLGGRKK